MINNKGYNFASDYWSHNVYQQAKNATSAQDGSPYGKKGDDNLLNQVNNTKQQNLIKEKFKTYE